MKTHFAKHDSLGRFSPEHLAAKLEAAQMSTELLVTIATSHNIHHKNMVAAALILLAPRADTLTEEQLVSIVVNISRHQDNFYLDSDAAETIRAACDFSREENRHNGQYAGTAWGYQPL